MGTLIQKLRNELGTPEQIRKAQEVESLSSENFEEQFKRQLEYSIRVFADQKFPVLSALHYFQIIKDSGIEIDDDNEEAIKLLCLYFGNDARFEEKGGKLNKGILLRGPVGCGKTTLLRKFSSNHRQSFIVTSCIDVSDGFSEEGTESLAKYYSLHRTGNVGRYFGQNMLGRCFDDLGTEDNPAIHFALRINVMEKILFQRYHRGIPFNATLLTTNLSNDQLSETYGERVYDRMKEMLNIIDFPSNAKSRRK